jgi:hypothetical protein
MLERTRWISSEDGRRRVRWRVSACTPDLCGAHTGRRTRCSLRTHCTASYCSTTSTYTHGQLPLQLQLARRTALESKAHEQHGERFRSDTARYGAGYAARCSPQRSVLKTATQAHADFSPTRNAFVRCVPLRRLRSLAARVDACFLMPPTKCHRAGARGG